jgi:hypothetical protein
LGSTFGTAIAGTILVSGLTTGAYALAMASLGVVAVIGLVAALGLPARFGRQAVAGEARP